MKKIISLIFLLLLKQFSYCQAFSFKVFFEDAAGNKDTIAIGYDPAATTGIDAAFGETNIISVPIDTNFDVRISDEWFNRLSSGTGTFHTKKQIVNYGCAHYEMFRIDVDIHSNYWPVKAKWNKTLFTDSCRSGFITSIMPGGWFDTGCPSDLLVRILSSTDSVIFTSQTLGGLDSYFNYLNAPGDTASVYWIGIGNGILDGSLVKETNQPTTIIWYPNPSTGLITSKNQSEKIKTVSVFSADGIKHPAQLYGNSLNLLQLENGIYFIQTTFTNGEINISRIVKEN